MTTDQLVNPGLPADPTATSDPAPFRFRRLSAWAMHLGAQTALWCGGGVLVGLQGEPRSPLSSEAAESRPLVVAAVAGALVACLAAWWIARYTSRRRLVFAAALHGLVMLTTLVAGECAVRALIPAWPARELHGIEPEEWARANLSPDGKPPLPGINRWGQRDIERSTTPASGVVRVAFLGDSFLEEGPAIPISFQVEERLGRADVEVLNLGVSATAPDEYYDRLCRIAAPLGARHCVLFLYAGNDFAAAPRTLTSFGGIAAVAPRQSLLHAVGLRGINHLLTNSERPVLLTWKSAGGLAARERQLHDFLRSADDDTARHALLNADQLPPADKARLRERIYQQGFDPFLAMLRAPDADRFRSYYLSAGLWSASIGGGAWEQDSPQAALYWTRQAAEFCRRRSIGLTVVIIPDAFQVDPRMAAQWAPLTDMRHLTAPTRRAAEEFRREAQQAGWDLLDLHESLDGVSGAYLNLDGHWSETGGAAAAAAVAAHLGPRLRP